MKCSSCGKPGKARCAWCKDNISMILRLNEAIQLLARQRTIIEEKREKRMRKYT